MLQCEFCGSDIPANASFCPMCGRAPSSVLKAQTMSSGQRLPGVQDLDTAGSMSVPGDSVPRGNVNQQSSNIDMPAAPPSLDQEEEEEKERRRRAAKFGLGAPRLESLVDGQPFAGNVPMVQGIPQAGGVPTVAGTPQFGSPPPIGPAPHFPGGSFGAGFHSSPTIMAPQQPALPPALHFPDTTSTLHHPYHPHHPLHPEPQGCGPKFLIVAITIPFLIILGSIGLALTVFAPNLSLSGSADVEQGGTFTLHGNHFIPGSSVTLTLDDTLPLYFTDQNVPVQPAYATNSSMQVLAISSLQAKQIPLSGNVVSAGGDGTFDVTITVDKSWSIGKHTIKATESLSHRSAELDFTVRPSSTTPTPSPTGTTSPSPTPAASPSPTATVTSSATTTPGSLSCVNPTSLALGPVSQGYTQPVSAQVTLCTNGTGTVNWTASWDQHADPWLQLDHTSGQISAPGQGHVNVSALDSNLAPGNYSVILTFTGQSNNVTESIPVSFTVQAGCVNGTPTALKYTGVANVSDPATQTVEITNCGPLGAWSATTQTTDGANWLFASPTGSTLNAGATTSVDIAASNLKAQLAAGTYMGTVTFKIGSSSFAVNVTLTVVAAPILSVKPTSIFANHQQCIPSTAGFYTCSVVLINTSTNLSLNWSATSSGLKGIVFYPGSGTLPPGQTILVKITVPYSNCPTKGILIFTGPGNTVNVTLYC